jgi:hypothetical protein
MADRTLRVDIIADSKGFTKATAEAERSVGKLESKLRDFGSKVGLSASAMDKAFAVAGPAALATAGLAVGKFVADSVGKFRDLALAVDEFSTATGTSLDSASRWVEVAGDVGVSADTVERAIGFMNRAVKNSPAAFDELGVSIQRTKDGVVDTDATFRNVVARLGQIEDPALRAATAQKILGRSWMELAPIISETNGSLERLDGLLANVSDAKIIDESEIEKAKQLREAQDRLGDAIEDISLALGESLIPALAGAAEAAAVLIEILNKLPDNENVNLLGGAFDITWGIIDDGIGKLQRLGGTVEGVAGQTSIAGGQFSGTADDLGFLAEKADTAAVAVSTLGDETSALLGLIDVEDLVLDIADGFDKVAEATWGAAEAARTGGAQAEAAARDQERAQNDLIRKVIEYDQEVQDLPDESVTDIIALIEQGKIDEAERKFNEVSRDRQAEVTATANTGSAEEALRFLARTRNAVINAQIIERSGPGFGGPIRQMGGPIPGPVGAPVMTLAHGGEFVLSADVVDAIKRGRKTEGLGARGGFGGGGTTIVMQPGAIVLNYPANAQVGRQVVEAIRAYERQGGR